MTFPYHVQQNTPGQLLQVSIEASLVQPSGLRPLPNCSVIFPSPLAACDS